MRVQKTELLEQLIRSCQAYYDITRDTRYDGIAVAAEAAFHSRSEKYVLTKKAQLWAMESNEYIFILLTEHLDKGLLQMYQDVILQEGLRRVEPKKDHMNTDISLVILADSVAPDVAATVKAIRFRKSYRFSFHGWSDFKVCVYNMADSKLITNKAGSQLKKLFPSVTKKIWRDKKR